MKEIEKAIGVFDSGLGGISVLKELRKHMPNENYIYFGDSAFAPYGIKDKELITNRCIYICDLLIQKGVKAIVIACNTATSACVQVLRERYHNLPIIGMEPALKPAVDQHSDQHVIVMATKFTLKEKKFENLMLKYNKDNVIYKLPCPKLVEIVENDQLSNKQIVEETLKEYLSSYDLSTIDSIVLGCTHFVFYKEQLQKIVGNQISIIDGNEGTTRHVKELLQAKNQLQVVNQVGKVTILNSSEDEAYQTLSKELLEC